MQSVCKLGKPRLLQRSSDDDQPDSVSRLIVLATRSARVSGFLPSSIHRAYSLRWVNGNLWYAAAAAGLSRKSCGELGRLDNDSLLMVLDEFDLEVITGPDVELAQQILAQAEVTLTAVDHEPGAVLDAVDVCEDRRSLARRTSRQHPSGTTTAWPPPWAERTSAVNAMRAVI